MFESSALNFKLIIILFNLCVLFKVESFISPLQNDKIQINEQDKSIDNNRRSPSKRNTKRETIASLCKDNITLTNEMIDKISDEYFQRTVKVVYLFRRRHSMKAAGLIRKMPDNNSNFALFSPMDR